MGWVIGRELISDGNRIVGSLVKSGDKWLVEILWTGPTGDIKFEAFNPDVAMGFIKGVEATFAAFTSTPTGD